MNKPKSPRELVQPRVLTEEETKAVAGGGASDKSNGIGLGVGGDTPVKRRPNA